MSEMDYFGSGETILLFFNGGMSGSVLRSMLSFVESSRKEATSASSSCSSARVVRVSISSKVLAGAEWCKVFSGMKGPKRPIPRPTPDKRVAFRRTGLSAPAMGAGELWRSRDPIFGRQGE